MIVQKIYFVCIYLFATIALIAEVEDDHAEHAEDESGSLRFTAEERLEVGITIASVSTQMLQETIIVPGEVSINAYRSSIVTPRVSAQVVKRHVQLGDEVELGQRLVTLSSVEMAEAQGALIVADQEWKRVKSLRKGAVSERRYTEAQVAQQLARAKVLAYGMTEEQVTELTKTGNAIKANGEFDLLAPQNGTVLHDDFIVGELIDPGYELFELSDESVLWVEARFTPTELPREDTLTSVRVSPDGTIWYSGRLTQSHHHVDPITRTRGLRIEVENLEHALHPGQFVEVEFNVDVNTPVLAVPTKSLTMIDGVQKVFLLEDEDEFHAEEVEVGPTFGDWTTVVAGLTGGEQIVVDGVFHLKSILLKSSMGEGHVH